ncbi:unnamed protein product [Brassica rapa]|uniref:Uncharacterized protein n=1 Tax=Brassica campestris TaxID=3711 RepID=A0A8D9GS75_BRACM|nr:unnamed protein product [Brassica rapa]
MMFSFTSLWGRIDHTINNGRYPYVFKISGENYHLMGDMLQKMVKSKFLQLYKYDNINEISNKIYFNHNICYNIKLTIITFQGTGADVSSLKDDIKLLDDQNPMLRLSDNLATYLMSRRTHNLPTADQVAALTPGDFIMNIEKRDIILELNTCRYHRISEKLTYFPLQCPILYCESRTIIRSRRLF